MNQLERAVVDAAIRWHGGPVEDWQPLANALDALLTHRATLAPDAGKDRTWGEVVEGDEVFIPRTGKWWHIIESRHGGDGRMRIIAKGAPKVLTPEPASPVKLRRSKTGEAVDLMNSILISGPEGVHLSTNAPVAMPGESQLEAKRKWEEQ